MDAVLQAKKLIAQTKNILILPPKDMQGDTLCGALALSYTLEKMGKNATLVTKNIPPKFRFLSKLNNNFAKRFAISVNTAGKQVTEMQYEKNSHDLKIYLALVQGELKGKDITFEGAAQNQSPELIITLGAKSIDEAELFNENPRIVYETPVINIDNQPDNENFGEVNVVNMASCSVSELVTDLIKTMEEQNQKGLLDDITATYLLTGIIAASQNFQNSRTKPKTIETASFLLEKGANHQKIIQHLLTNRTVSQIKLLGKILEKLIFDAQKQLYSVVLALRDFQESGATPKDLAFAMEDLKAHLARPVSLLILWESHSSVPSVKGVFYSLQKERVQNIAATFNGQSKKEYVLFTVPEGHLQSVYNEVIKIL